MESVIHARTGILFSGAFRLEHPNYTAMVVTVIDELFAVSLFTCDIHITEYHDIDCFIRRDQTNYIKREWY